MTSELNNESILNRLVHLSARYLDDQKYDDFLALFSNEGRYSITCKAPELSDKMTWMQQTKQELAERLNSMTEHEWEIALVTQTRIVSVDIINVDNEDAELSSSFALYNTEQSGRTSCYAVGRYEDKWIRQNDTWLLVNREVELKTRILEMPSPLPI